MTTKKYLMNKQVLVRAQPLFLGVYTGCQDFQQSGHKIQLQNQNVERIWKGLGTVSQFLF